MNQYPEPQGSYSVRVTPAKDPRLKCPSCPHPLEYHTDQGCRVGHDQLYRNSAGQYVYFERCNCIEKVLVV